MLRKKPCRNSASLFRLVCSLAVIQASIFCKFNVANASESSSIDKATDIVAFFDSSAKYKSRYWYSYWPNFNVYDMRKNLSESEQYQMVYSFLEDCASLIKPHMSDDCNDYFFFGTRDNKQNNYSRLISMYSGVFSLDPELGHAWMVYLLNRSWWERLWGGNILWKDFRKSCKNDGVTVEEALTSIAAGREFSYEAGR